MNKRIKELAEQATTYIDPSANDGVCWYFDKEKFAELIVQECLNICEEMGDNGKDGHYCADKIVKTFRS